MLLTLIFSVFFSSFVFMFNALLFKRRREKSWYKKCTANIGDSSLYKIYRPAVVISRFTNNILFSKHSLSSLSSSGACALPVPCIATGVSTHVVLNQSVGMFKQKHAMNGSIYSLVRFRSCFPVWSDISAMLCSSF